MMKEIIKYCKNGELYNLQKKYYYENCKNIIEKNKNVIFAKACEGGKMEMVQWIYNDIEGVDIGYNSYESFKRSCYKGNIKIAKWLYYLGIDLKVCKKVETINVLDISFYLAGINGNIELLEWLYELGRVKDWIIERLWKILLEYDNAKVKKWVETKKMITDEMKIRYLNEKFEEACLNEDLELCQKIIFSISLNNKEIQKIFEKCCYKDLLISAKWLYSNFTEINVNRNEEEIFRICCFKGCFKTAKWLKSLGINHNAVNDFAFRWSCKKGYIKQVKWLYSLGVNIYANEGESIKYSKINGYYEIFEWLKK